jgi:endonuclease YncB( thermonuclease family)
MAVLIGICLSSFAYAGKSVYVVDGDTIDVGHIRYRLFGIDAPESEQKCKTPFGKQWPCGAAALAEMEDLVRGKDVTCEDRGDGEYGRRLGLCRVDGMDVSAAMVDKGLAWSFKRYSHAYDTSEDMARKKKIGIWQAETQPAWAYRADRWSLGSQSAPDKRCPIKGNINRKHQKIYHVPWDKDYNRTKIDVVAGERWFCTEAQAVKAGWRAPQLRPEH